MRLATVAVTLAVLAGTARAEDPKKAETFFRMGEKAYKAQNFAAAAEHFYEAYQNFPLPEIAFSAAQAYRRLYRLDPKPEHVQRAVDLYRAYLAKVQTGGRVADAADALGELQHELDKLIAAGVKVSPELATAHTRLIINVTLGEEQTKEMHEIDDKSGGASATIEAQLDGKPAEPFTPLNVAPGAHEIKVSAPGYFEVAHKETATQGSTTVAEVKLEPKPATVTIATEGGARVIVDGRPAGTAPLSPLELAAGKHVVAIQHRGRKPVARELVLARGQTLTLPAPLDHTTRRKTVPWLLGGAGVATLICGVNVALAISADSTASDLLADIHAGNQPPSVVDDYEQARDQRRYATYGAWTFGAAAIGLTTIGLLLYYTDTPSADGVRVEPFVAGNTGGAVVSGRF